MAVSRRSIKICLQEAVRHSQQRWGGGAAAPLESPSPLLNTFLSHGYLIVSQGEKGERSANKRCLNKLAGGHVLQTAGIVPGRQAPTGREPPVELVWVWAGPRSCKNPSVRKKKVCWRINGSKLHL